MHRYQSLFFYLAGFFSVSLAFADADKASFRIGHNVLTYKSITHTVTPDASSATTSKTTHLNTYTDGWEFYISKDKMNYYVYPGQQDSIIMVGYSMPENLEIGGHLGLKKSSRDKAADADNPKLDAMSTIVGAYVTYVADLFEGNSLELTFMPTFISSSDMQTNLTHVETKSKSRTVQVNLSAIYNRLFPKLTLLVA